MSRNNDVFQVLVTKGDQPVLAVGNQVADLAPGQIGVFDFNTNISVDGSAPVRNFYLAVGLDTDNDGVTDDVAKSAGSHIQNRNIEYYSFRPHTPGQPQKTVLKDYTAECETEYGIKLELRNQEIYRTQGYNQFTKAYSITTSCCGGCIPTCPSGDANEITKKLIEAINADGAGLITAQAVARQPLTAAQTGTVAIATGDPVTLAELEAIMAFNAGEPDTSTFVYTDLEICTVTQKINTFCSVDLSYFYPRQTIAILTKIGDTYQGFNCTGTIEVTQEAVFEEGAGYDVKQQEYMAKGWSESPYRVSTLNGVADSKRYNADASESYDQIALTYDQFSRNAWLEYLNNEATIIAIPGTDTNTRDTLIPLLDLFLTPNGFDALADDAAIADVNPTVVETTTGIDDVALDGIA